MDNQSKITEQGIKRYEDIFAPYEKGIFIYVRRQFKNTIMTTESYESVFNRVKTNVLIQLSSNKEFETLTHNYLTKAYKNALINCFNANNKYICQELNENSEYHDSEHHNMMPNVCVDKFNWMLQMKDFSPINCHHFNSLFIEAQKFKISDPMYNMLFSQNTVDNSIRLFIFITKYFYNMKTIDLAKQLNIEENTIKTRLHRQKQIFKNLLSC